jgi:beta-carotene hydroxylase
VHSNISSRTKSLRWVDTVAGVIACVPLWLHYHQHKRQHMQHHAHTNEETDPDIYAKGSFLAWVLLRAPAALLSYFNPVQQYRDCKRFQCSRRDYVYTAPQFQRLWQLSLASSRRAWPGSGVPVVCAMVIGQTVMLTFFTRTPHHDQRNGALPQHAFLLPGANFPAAGQNYHLIHHNMIPSIPHTAINRLTDASDP